MTRPLDLGDAARAELYQGLGRGLSAGLPAAQVLDALQGALDGDLDPRLKRAANALRKGTALPLALERQGLVTAPDMVLLAAADDSGTVDRIALALAARYDRSATRWRQLKGRLMLPLAVLAIAIIVLPIPALAAGERTPAEYVTGVIAMLGLLGVLALVGSRIVRRWRATGTPGWLTSCARLLPGIAAMSRLHQRADVCERLALALASGLPARDALTAMRNTQPHGVRRRGLVSAQRALGGGAGVADALEHAGVLDPSSFAIIATGEAAGRLDETLSRVASSCHDALDDAYTLLAQWIPVLLYLAVAGVVAGGLLG